MVVEEVEDEVKGDGERQQQRNKCKERLNGVGATVVEECVGHLQEGETTLLIRRGATGIAACASKALLLLLTTAMKMGSLNMRNIMKGVMMMLAFSRIISVMMPTDT